MWGRAVWALRGLFDVPAGLLPYGDHYHDNAPLQNLLRDGHTCVRRPVFDGFRLWTTTTTTTQRTLPARHGAAAPRLHMRVPGDHHHLAAGVGRRLRRG